MLKKIEYHQNIFLLDVGIIAGITIKLVFFLVVQIKYEKNEYEMYSYFIYITSQFMADGSSIIQGIYCPHLVCSCPLSLFLKPFILLKKYSRLTVLV